MEFGHVNLFILFLVVRPYTLLGEEYSDEYDAISNHTAAAYSVGVHMGIINPKKYSFQSFQSDDRNIFKKLYEDYISLNNSQPINYQEWLIMNNYGILADTQESIFERKTIIGRRKSHNKIQFLNSVRKGDILITAHGEGGLAGHAAIMTSDYWVLEMAGGKNWKMGIKKNNKQHAKDAWFDMHASDWTSVYRCPHAQVAWEAAVWADHNYFNRHGGGKRNICVTYKITTDFYSLNPSYSSKMVLQAYYYGTDANVIRDMSKAGVIVPSSIPAYFMPPYTLKSVGRF